MIIAGFPGIGKTDYCKNNPLRTHDADSNTYSRLSDGTRNPNFIEDYFNHLTEVNYIQPIIILVSSTASVLEELKRRDWDYFVIIPEEGLLEEYIQRYVDRGDTADFIELVRNNWYQWLRQIKANHRVFELRSGQYLRDFLVEVYETSPSSTNAMDNIALKK